MHIKDLYDSTRWFIYTYHCDNIYLPIRDSLKSMTFGELPLKFDDLKFINDTIEINFQFLDILEPIIEKREPILPGMTRDTRELLSGVAFNIKTRQKVYMASPNGFTIVIKGGANRYENPLQPEVLTYIKKNWIRLDSCFRELAIQKGKTN